EKPKALYLGYWQITDVGLKELRSLKNLESLKLGSTKITDAGLVELRGMKNLQTLDLSHTKIADTGLAELARLKSLHSLDLGYTKVTDAGLKMLAGMKLKKLFVPRDSQTDLGLKHYLAAIETPDVLYLAEWRITDASVKELAR